MLHYHSEEEESTLNTTMIVQSEEFRNQQTRDLSSSLCWVIRYLYDLGESLAISTLWTSARQVCTPIWYSPPKREFGNSEHRAGECDHHLQWKNNSKMLE